MVRRGGVEDTRATISALGEVEEDSEVKRGQSYEERISFSFFPSLFDRMRCFVVMWEEPRSIHIPQADTGTGDAP
jgi:hypothetical protein